MELKCDNNIYNISKMIDLKNSSSEEAFKAEYINYEDLEDITLEKNKKLIDTIESKDCNIIIVNNKMFKNIEELSLYYINIIISLPRDQWVDIFISYNCLRSILKYYPLYIISNIELLKDSIIKDINSIRSNIAKIALIFITELFALKNKDISNNTNNTLLFIPVLFNLQTQKTKKFLSDQSSKAIENILDNFENIELLILLISLNKDKNVHYTNLVFKSTDFYAKKISQINNNELFVNTNNEYIYRILNELTELFNLKKEPYYKRSLELLKFICININNNVLKNIIEINSNKLDINTLKKMFAIIKFNVL